MIDVVSVVMAEQVVEALEARGQGFSFGLIGGAIGEKIGEHYGNPELGKRIGEVTGGTLGALAGGMLARWLSTGGEPSGLLDALVWGVACASIAIGSIGVKGIAKATPAELAQRVSEVEESLRRES